MEHSIEYWQGLTDGRLEAMEASLKKIDTRLESIDGKVDRLRFKKTKVAGIASAVSAAVLFLVEVVRAALTAAK